MVIVTWTSSADNGWCSLDSARLAGVHMTGVFLIWYTGNPGRVVYVGRGDIAEELAAVRGDEAVQRYRTRGDLLVTWAKVSAARIDGIERYLAETWSPLVQRTRPEAAAIEVNSPGWMRAFV